MNGSRGSGAQESPLLLKTSADKQEGRESTVLRKAAVLKEKGQPGA